MVHQQALCGKILNLKESDGYCDEAGVISSDQESAEEAFPCSAEQKAAEHTDLLLHREARCLSRGTFLARFTELLLEIKDFLNLSKHADRHPKLEDHQWRLELPFLTDLTGEQGKQQGKE